MPKDLKTPPPYAVASVDHALRIAAWLQLEGSITVTEAANRLGVARSTAHRLLAMLVYRDFALHEDSGEYRAGPVLELAGASHSATARLREASLGPIEALVARIGETANLIIRTGDTARFVASVECSQALRVGNREGMVFPAHRVAGGRVLLAELDDAALAALYAPERYADRPDERPDVERLLKDLARIRKSGFAVNQGVSERGLVAVGRAVPGPDGAGIAGLSISMPSVRYTPQDLPRLDAALRDAAQAIARLL